MNPIDIKMEKANAILEYRLLPKLMNLVRFIEMFVISVMISKFSSQIPSAFSVSADYFGGNTFTVFSPKVVFVIGNLIILILFFKSRTDENGDGDGDGYVDLGYEYVKSYDMNVKGHTTSGNVIVSSSKRMICKSKSENPIKTKCRDGQTHQEWRRSMAELSRSKSFCNGDGDDDDDDDTTVVDVGGKLSSEEFRRTVEAFIAKRQKLLRDEELSPME